MKILMHPLQREFDRLYKEMNDLYHDTALAVGLSDSCLTVLYAICELGDGCLQRDICERCFSSKQTVHSAVRKLKEDGYVRLESGRGRDMHLFLTPEGEALAEKTVLLVAEAEYQALDSMAAEDREEMVRLTRHYVSSLRKELKSIP